MDGKVLLYNSDNVRIGETYVRRARQLVKQQRAFWVDDSQTAVKFAPNMENLDDATAADVNEDRPMYDADAMADEKLMRLARRRVHARFAFKLHSSIALAVSLFLLIIFFSTGGGYFWPIWPILSLGFGVAIHGLITKIVVGGNMNDKIAQEYEQLKYRNSHAGYMDKRH